MAKYCGNCGRELPDEALYCPNCGQEYIPRYKADHYSNETQKKEFNGPFDDFNNRSSKNPFESSSKSTNSNSKTQNNDESFPLKKVCCAVFILLMLFALIGFFASERNYSDTYDTSIIEDTADNISVDSYSSNRNPHEEWGSIGLNDHYNMSIDENAYISGQGEAQLIDSNHSYNIESDGFNITEYETYYVNVDDEDWYVLDIFKCKFDSPAQSQVYATDMDDGDPIIIYGPKGEYYGYGIIMPNSSDNATYKNLDFLESIFYYKRQ